MKILLGISGASGAIYAKKIIEYFSNNKENELSLIFTDTAKKVWEYEINDFQMKDISFEIYENDDFFTPAASGSSDFEAMIVCPCSMGTMAKIANGIADNLLTRAADVMLKENKRLVIVPREMPYNLIHISNMKKLMEAGAKICPASPSFYQKPQTIDELVVSVVQKILNLVDIRINTINWNPKK